jgi:hypothetical protein
MARNQLTLTGYEAEMVLMPGQEGKTSEAMRITVLGPNFPQRAVAPEILVGETGAERVTVAPDQRSIRGYFGLPPADGGIIRVRYGDSQEGLLREGFSRGKVRPLPQGCG